MNRTRRRLADGTRIAALAVCMLAVCVGIIGAQPRPGQPPIGQPPPIPKPFVPPVQPPPVRPPIRPPVVAPAINPIPPMPMNEMIWECTRCRGILSRGGPEPVHIQNCPHCGARFVNGGGGGGFQQAPINPPNQGQPINQGNLRPGGGANASSGSSILIGVIVGIIALIFVGGCAVLGLVLVFKNAGSSKPTTRPRRSRDSVYDY